MLLYYLYVGTGFLLVVLLIAALVYWLRARKFPGDGFFTGFLVLMLALRPDDRIGAAGASVTSV